MKKLLTVSVLAATLAATAVFAQSEQTQEPGSSAQWKRGYPNPSAAEESQKQTPELVATISQALEAQGIKPKTPVTEFNPDRSLLKARIDLPKKLAPKVEKDIQNAVAKLVKETNQEAGYAATNYNAPPTGGRILFILAAAINGSFFSYEAQLNDNRMAIIITREEKVDRKTLAILEKAKAKAEAEGIVKAKSKWCPGSLCKP